MGRRLSCNGCPSCVIPYIAVVFVDYTVYDLFLGTSMYSYLINYVLRLKSCEHMHISLPPCVDIKVFNVIFIVVDGIGIYLMSV